MPPVAFEAAIPASDGAQTVALDRSATGIGIQCVCVRAYTVCEYHIVSSLIKMIDEAAGISKDDRCYTHLIPVKSDSNVICQ
jgi:hypothetical protein